MRHIPLSQSNGDVLFVIDIVDRQELVTLLATKITSEPDYDRIKRLRDMLRALAPNHEALKT